MWSLPTWSKKIDDREESICSVPEAQYWVRSETKTGLSWDLDVFSADSCQVQFWLCRVQPVSSVEQQMASQPQERASQTAGKSSSAIKNSDSCLAAGSSWGGGLCLPSSKLRTFFLCACKLGYGQAGISVSRAWSPQLGNRWWMQVLFYDLFWKRWKSEVAVLRATVFFHHCLSFACQGVHRVYISWFGG